MNANKFPTPAIQFLKEYTKEGSTISTEFFSQYEQETFEFD